MKGSPTLGVSRTCSVDSVSLSKLTANSSLSLSDNDEASYEFPQEVANRLVKRTSARVEKTLEESEFFQTNCRLEDLPRFEREDLDIGDLIAYGGFSNVHELKAFKSESELDAKKSPYVVKNLNPKLAHNPKKLIVGAKDIVMEAHFLSSLKHENIIQLRGWSAAGISGFAETGRADGFFLIFDRLQETLNKRISAWKERAKDTKKGTLLKSKTTMRMELFAERIQCATEIASAVEYLHSKRIVYRDLKPANIGFNREGKLQLFDFGLAVEVPQGTHPNATYNLSGNTGTSRYMAVEVIRKQPYNCKVDVFSFSILLWEIMALTKPYDGLAGPQVKECVSIFGERPAIPRTWPSALRHLLKRGWCDSIEDRPFMDEVRHTLHQLHESSRKTNKFFGR